MSGVMSETLSPEQMVETLREVLPELLAGLPVSLVYLYGSAARGRMTQRSDVDIALVLEEDLTPLERLRLILRLGLSLSDRCGIENPDVRVINDAPLLFRGRVVTEGILVYEKSDEARIEFETYTRMRYFDYLPVHRRMQDELIAGILARGLYG